MAKHKKTSSTEGWRSDQKTKCAWLKKIMAFPLVEAILALIFGMVFYFFVGNKILAELTWVLGPALSLSRMVLEKHMENEFDPLKRLIRHVDLIQSDINDSFKKIIQLYAQIAEPDFRRIKDGIIKDAEAKLSALAHNKRSDELNTGEYFDWLFRFLENTRPGSTIWAISMNLEIEWKPSQEEDTFLQLNLEAADRRVNVERVFVVPEKIIEDLIKNKYIKSQLDAASEYLTLLFVTKEHIEKVDKNLLNSLGAGIIAVDNQVVLIDIASAEGFRGIVTMNPTEIEGWCRRFQHLRVYASGIEKLLEEVSTDTMKEV